VKSKAAKAVDVAKPASIAPPPADMSMDDAMDLYHTEVDQYS
jgi:DNA polymerase III subunit alpha